MSRTSRELVAKVLNMFKNWMQILFPNNFARLSCQCRERVAARFWRIYNAKFLRHSYKCRARVSHDGRATVLIQHAKKSRLSGEKIKLSDIRTNVMRHSHECRATVIRIKMKIRYIHGKVVRHSHECCATVTRLSCDSREIYFQN